MRLDVYFADKPYSPTEALGTFTFREVPGIGETLWVGGQGTYKVVGIVHLVERGEDGDMRLLVERQ